MGSKSFGGGLVKVKMEENVAIVTLSRPEGKKVNVLTAQVMQGLDEGVTECQSNNDIRVIVMTGEGPYTFIAGADIKEIAKIESAEMAQELVKRGQAILDKIQACPKPVICAVNAVCVGGGLELAMACHMRIASDRAKFGQPEIMLGIVPGFGGTQRLPRLVGTAKALEILLTGDMINAKEAYEIGLVNRVVSDSRLLKESIGLANKIAQKPQVAARLIQQAVMEGTLKTLAEGLSLEAGLFGQVCESSDKKEGVSAFLEKRQPKFTNL